MEKQKHSRSYHRYFENYAEREIVKPGGGTAIERVYVGNYYRVDLPDDALRRKRIRYAALFLCCLAGYLAGALLSGVSVIPLVALATMLPLLTLFFLAFSVFCHLTAPREMEIRIWRDSSETLIRRSRNFAVCTAVCFLATLISPLLLSEYSLSETLPSLFFYLISGLAGAGIWREEKDTPYKTLPPRHERPEKSSPIRYEMPD